MKRFTRLFSLILAVALIISIFPAATASAAEKKYKLFLTGEYDLDDEYKVIYNYNKMIKNVKLKKVEGKNQWNLTMYAGTTVELPYTAAATVDKIECVEYPDYRRVHETVGHFNETFSFTAHEQTLESKERLEDNVYVYKAYNKKGKCISTLKINITVLPYNAKLERTKLITAKELYKLEYRRGSFSEFTWEHVIKNCPEMLMSSTYAGGLKDQYYHHVADLRNHGHQVPQYLFDRFGGKDADELLHNMYEMEPYEIWGFDEDIEGFCNYLDRVDSPWERDQETMDLLDSILDSLELEQYETDWDKVDAIQDWVETNIEYDYEALDSVVYSSDVYTTLTVKKTICDGYANLMSVACMRIGIPCYKISSYQANHAWNIVLVDGLWFMLDATWGQFGDWATGVYAWRYENTQPVFELLVQVLGGRAGTLGDMEVRYERRQLERVKNWEYLPQEYQEMIERETADQKWRTYKSAEDIPQRLRDLSKNIWADFMSDWDGFNLSMLTRYKTRLNPIDKHEEKGTADQSFMDWYIDTHLLGNNPEEYLEWMQNEYDAKLHGDDPFVYWYNSTHHFGCHCGCWNTYEMFPDIFEYVSEMLQLEAKTK